MLARLLSAWADRGRERRIKRFGWTAFTVYGAGPDWTYTVGFAETLASPEVVMSSVPRDIAQALIWDAFRKIQVGELRLRDDLRWDVEDLPCIWREVHPSQIVQDNFGLALRRRRQQIGRDDDLRVFQLVCGDEAGRFPWEAGHNPDHRGEQAAFYLPAE